MFLENNEIPSSERADELVIFFSKDISNNTNANVNAYNGKQKAYPMS
jgi:hypothetical protein